MENVPVFDPETITDAEVRSILSELGYENINPDHLRQFIADLKRMIRRDQAVGALSNNGPASRTSPNSAQSLLQLGTHASSKPSLSVNLSASNENPVFFFGDVKQKNGKNRVNVNVGGNELSIEESLSLAKSSSRTGVSSERPRSARSASGESPRSDALDQVPSGREEPTIMTEVKCKPSQSRPQDPRLLKDPVRLYHWYNTHWQRRPPPSNPKQAATFQPPQFH